MGSKVLGNVMGMYILLWSRKKRLKIPKGNQKRYIKKNRQHIGQKKINKRTNNDLQNIHITPTRTVRIAGLIPPASL